MSGKALVEQSFLSFNKNAENVTGQLNWSWDAKSGICYIRIPAAGKESRVEITR